MVIGCYWLMVMCIIMVDVYLLVDIWLNHVGPWLMVTKDGYNKVSYGHVMKEIVVAIKLQG